MPPTSYLPMCSTKDGGHIYFSPLLTFRKKIDIENSHVIATIFILRL